MSSIANSLLLLLNDKMIIAMDKPLFSEYCHALEYKHLFKSHDDMNFYSAKEDDNDYIMVDDYDCGNYDVWSEIPIVLLKSDRLLCKRDEKYGVVNTEGWTIIPFVYDRFDKFGNDRYSVLLGNRWGVIDSSGKEFFRTKYSNPIPILEFPKRVSDDMLCRGTILVEDADTHRKGLVDFDGREIIPTIYSKIERSGNWDYVYVNFGAMEKTDPDCTWDGVWGCCNWQGKEIIPVKYHAIHYINEYFIAGDDEYQCGDVSVNRYYGTYDLYDLEGTMIIGGFNNCQIGTNYFILNFGIVVKSYWETTYWGNTEIEYGDELVKELNCDKMYSIIVDKDLKSFIPRHLINETREEIEYEFDFLYNNLPAGEGLLIGEFPKLCKGKRYSENDKIIKGISVCSASYINDTVVMYSTSKKNVMPDGSIAGLKGIVFCNERMVIAPTYIDVKSINSKLLFIQNERGSVGIRNVTKELLEPQFSLITNPYNNIAIGFKIKYIEGKEIYQCQCYLLKFNEDSIHKEDIVKMTGSQLYELLYCEFSNWRIFELSEEHLALITQYWRSISHNNNCTFWYSYCQDFRWLWEDEHYEETKDSMFDDSNENDWTDWYNWEYYNEGLDMDQQDERFWNF